MSQRLLVVGLLVLLGQAWAVDCDQWNTRGFFEEATLEEVKGCLEAGADVNAQDELGYTPLHGAVEYSDNPAIVALLLEAGAEVNAQSGEGITPLIMAAFHNSNIEIFTLLIDAGADVEFSYRFGYLTPLHLVASYSDNPAIITALIDAGADPNDWNEYGSTPLHYAAWDRNPAVIAALLDGGADVGARSPFYSTPLHWAAGANEDPDAIAVLLAAGADPNARDGYGNTPLQWAAESNNPAVIAALLDGGADAKVQNAKGKLPWDYAKDRKELRDTRVYQLLHEAWLPNGAALAVDCTGWTTREFFETATPEEVADCLAAGAGVDATHADGPLWFATPLHRAARDNEDPDVIAVLLAAGADPNARDNFGDTPLYMAAEYSTNPEVIILLLEAGASAKVDQWDPTAWDLAQRNDGGAIRWRSRAWRGTTAWDLARSNEALKGTEAYERLREATLGVESE